MIRVKKTFVLSDQSVNCYGFNILTAGLDLRQFMKNPIMLRNHEGEAVGVWENIRVEGEQLLAEPAFSDTCPELAQKVKEGTLRAASIGVDNAVFSLDSKYRTDKNPNGTLIKGVVYEGSIVEFPGNENALALFDNHMRLKLSSKHDFEHYIYNEDHLFTNRNQLKMTKETLTLLNLDENAKATDVHNAILKLVGDNVSLKTTNETLTDARNHEVVESAVTLGKISYGQAEHYKLLLKNEFNSTKALLESIEIPKPLKKDIKISDLIKRGNADKEEQEKKDNSKAPKNKSDWTLNDYRKFASKELKSNPNLYEELVKKENKSSI